MKRCSNKYCNSIGSLQIFDAFEKEGNKYSDKCKSCIELEEHTARRRADPKDFVAQQATILLSLENEQEKLQSVRSVMIQMDGGNSADNRCNSYARNYHRHVMATVKTLKALVI